jgi:hypothetical protein
MKDYPLADFAGDKKIILDYRTFYSGMSLSCLTFYARDCHKY